MIHVKNLLTLLGFSFHKHCSLYYFRCHSLAHLNFQLIVGNTTVFNGGLSTSYDHGFFVDDSDIFYLKCDCAASIGHEISRVS